MTNNLLNHHFLFKSELLFDKKICLISIGNIDDLYSNLFKLKMMISIKSTRKGKSHLGEQL